MNAIKPLSRDTRTASLFRNGRNQAVRIPVEFELPGKEVEIEKDGDTLIIRAKPEKKRTLLEILSTMGPLSREEWPDIDDSDMLPLDDIKL